MNICLVTPSMNSFSGGPPRVIAGSARSLANLGHNISIYALSEPGTTPSSLVSTYKELDHPNIKIHLHVRDGPFVLGLSGSLINAINLHIKNIDVIHIHGVWELCLSKLQEVAKKNCVKFFVSPHGMLDPWSMSQSRVKKFLALYFFGVRRMLTKADGIIFGTQDELIQSYNISSSTSFIVPNGVDSLAMERDALPKKKWIVKNHPKILRWSRTLVFFGRIHPKKGIDILLKAFKRILSRFPNAGLMIIGISDDEEYEAKLRQYISINSLDDNIIFTNNKLGFEALAAYRYADLFVLPSHQEGFSVAIIESMSLGMPVLITDQCHIPEIAEKWKCGWVVVDSESGVFDGLLAAFESTQDKLDKMGMAARKTIVSNYDWTIIAGKLENVYCSKVSR